MMLENFHLSRIKSDPKSRATNPHPEPDPSLSFGLYLIIILSKSLFLNNLK